jgi:hypothetical protein
MFLKDLIPFSSGNISLLNLYYDILLKVLIVLYQNTILIESFLGHVT